MGVRRNGKLGRQRTLQVEVRGDEVEADDKVASGRFDHFHT
jgi:hypothetical protein